MANANYVNGIKGENRSFDELISKDENLEFKILEEKMKKQLEIESLSVDILKTLGILRMDGRYSNAGALLADRNSFHGIDCARFGETIDVILDRETFEHKSILKMYDDVVNLYRKYYQYDEIQGAVRKTVETIPEKAFRETIANALVHRAWDIRAHIRVAMYRDRIEVFSPGGLPKGITQEEYLGGQISILRNPIIGSVFFRLHIIESFGTGIQRINAAYAESKVKPTHEFTENSIKVTLPIVQITEDMSENEYAVYRNMSKTGMSSSQIAAMAGFGKNKTLQILTALENNGYITKIGKGRGTKYVRN